MSRAEVSAAQVGWLGTASAHSEGGIRSTRLQSKAEGQETLTVKFVNS